MLVMPGAGNGMLEMLITSLLVFGDLHSSTLKAHHGQRLIPGVVLPLSRPRHVPDCGFLI